MLISMTNRYHPRARSARTVPALRLPTIAAKGSDSLAQRQGVRGHSRLLRAFAAVKSYRRKIVFAVIWKYDGCTPFVWTAYL